MEKQSGGKQKPSVSIICNCNLLVYDNRAGNSAKLIADAKLHVPIVTKDKVNLTKQLSSGFKRSAY